MTDHGQGETPARALDALLDFAHIPEGTRVLCMGTGAPALLRILQRRGFAAVGLSPAPPAGPGSPGLVGGDAAAAPFRDRAFGAALCVDLLEGRDIEAILAEAARTLQPGALLAIREPVRPAGGSGAGLTAEELCAHMAGEQLGVVAHTEEATAGDGGGTAVSTWVLRVPPPQGSARTRTYIQEDR